MAEDETKQPPAPGLENRPPVQNASMPSPVRREAGAAAVPGKSFWEIWRWPLVVLGLAAMVLIGFIISLQTTERLARAAAREMKEGAGVAMKRAVEIAAAFQQGQITETFTAAIPTMESTGMGNLEVATAQATESFSRSEGKTIAWDTIYLGTTTTEIKVPVTYRYHIQLADEWKLEVDGQTCLVTAPKLRPSLPPAIHTDGIQRRSERGWGLFNEGLLMEELERGLTDRLSQMAADRRHIRMAREEARKTVAEFVRNWLLREEHWRSDRFRAVKVRFSDEPEDVAIGGPVILMEEKETVPPQVAE